VVIQHQPALRVVPFLGIRLQIGANKVRIPVVAEIPIPDEEVFTSSPGGAL
jgi:hypothetical protein